MATTATNEEQLTIKLPTSLVKKVRSRIASGEFASEEELILESVLRLIESEEAVSHGLSNQEFDEWLRSEAVPVLEALDADPSQGLSIDQVRANLAVTRSNFQKAG